MARNTKLIPGGEETAGTADEDENDSQSISTPAPRSIAARNSLPADDPLPIFLSDPDEEPEPQDAGKLLDKTGVSSLVFKASFLGAAAAAIAIAVLSVDNPLSLLASAKASLIGLSASSSSTSQPASALQPPVVAAAPVPITPPAAKEGPTREEIAAAFKAIAQQGQTEVPPPPVAAPPARRLEADEVAALLKRAKGLIGIGDIAAARLLLERAADAQEATAALLLAQTYDPVVLGKPDTRSITPDPAKARDWYEKAARFGSQDAQQRLSQIQN